MNVSESKARPILARRRAEDDNPVSHGIVAVKGAPGPRPQEHQILSSLRERKAMSVEYIREIAFLQEVRAAGQVWVARSVNSKIYSLEIEPTGFSLPIWSNSERVIEFLKNAMLVGAKYEPHAVPLEVFTNAWLSDTMMAIAELQINPDGKTTRVLVLTAEEFKSAQASK